MMDDEGNSDIMSSESSEDDEVLFNEPRVKNQNYFLEVVPQYSEEVFFEHFRLSRETTNNISLRYENSHYFHDQTGSYGCIPASEQVLIYLWYIGHQTASFRDVADRFDVTISSIYRVINRITSFLSNLSKEIIKWPNEAEKQASEVHFRANGFPNIIGAIDGSHIKIDKPATDPESYINRKGYYSIQMQAVCDHKRKIIDVFVGYPGSVHDSRVFRNSPLCQNLEERCGQYFLLGDSGYPLQRNLLTPYKDFGNLNRLQTNYNIKLARNRYVIEHCFGILKQKFRQMYHIKMRNIHILVHFIRAACVLHNIGIDDEFVVNVENQPIYEVPANLPAENFDENVELRAIRDRVANTLEM